MPLLGCSFVPSGGAGGDGDAAVIDGAGGDGALADDASAVDAAEIDAAIDAPVDAPVDAPIDARACPAPPTGCTSFTCAGSSHCYYACNATSWTNAESRCASNNLGCLATIDDAVENQCIHDATQPVFPNLVWFGWRQDAAGAEPVSSAISMMYLTLKPSLPPRSASTQRSAAILTVCWPLLSAVPRP